MSFQSLPGSAGGETGRRPQEPCPVAAAARTVQSASTRRAPDGGRRRGRGSAAHGKGERGEKPARGSRSPRRRGEGGKGSEAVGRADWGPAERRPRPGQ